VVVDDYLPFSQSGKLVYAHCRDKREMWVPLVEKAYAKLHSCYEAIESGSETTAFRDLTGFPPEER
jgi:calpain